MDALTQILWRGKTVAVLTAALAAMAVASPAAGWAAGQAPIAGQSPAAGQVPAAAPGTRLWVGRYEGAGLSDSRAADVAVSPGGKTVYVTGSTEYPDATGSMPVSYFATVAYNAVTGKRLWVQRFLGPGIAAFANAIAVSPDGSEIYVTGLAEIGDPARGSDLATVAYNARTGHYLWSRLYSGPIFGAGEANAVTVSPDGSKVVITGATFGSSTDNLDLATVAYDAAGTMLWSKRTPGNPGTSIVTSPDGSNIYVGTGSQGGGGSGAAQFSTVAYSSATGRQLWLGTYPGPGHLIRCTIAASQDGGKVFAACTTDRSPAKYLTLAYAAADGDPLWQARYGLGSFASTASAIAASGSQVFVTGTANGHLGTVAYQADTGSQQWVSLYPTPGGTAAAGFSLAVSADGSTVFAAGGANSSYATVAYNPATGAKRWGRQWFGDGGGSAFSLAVSPAGDRVFVTGVTSLPVGDGSFATVYGTVAYGS